MLGQALKKRETLLVTTTPHLEGLRIAAYHGVVSGEAIMGTNIFRDIFAGVRDIVGGRSGAYEKALRKAKAIALREMEEEARRLGANAVISVALGYENISLRDGSGMLMVCASGTAVTVAY
jgi:uncharacterized protein YbjQ (UPF0145 family)